MSKQLPVGGHVEVLMDDNTWVPAEVIDLLSSQFTAEVESFGLQFFFYNEKGLTWKQLQE